MRRKDREIFGDEIEAVLKKGEYGVLAVVCPDGSPYAVPLNYVWYNGAIYFHCAAQAGKKLESIQSCEKVCFTVVGDTHVQPEEFGTLYESVVAQGKIREAEDKKAGLTAILAKYSGDYMEEGIRYMEAVWKHTAVYKIVPVKITGKAKRR